MYDKLADTIAAQDNYSKTMLEHIPAALHGPALDLLAAEHPQLKQMLDIAYHNGREAAYNEARESVEGATTQAHQWREKLRYIYDHASDSAKAEIGVSLNEFNNHNNN